MSDLTERAIERIDDLDAFIQRLNSESLRPDSPTEATNELKKVGRYGIPKEVVGRCEASISAILAVLSDKDIPIQLGAASRPPKWWCNVRSVAEHQRLKTGGSEAALTDALDILERHVSRYTPHLSGLALLIGDLHDKIVTRPATYGFRAPSEPRANNVAFFFDPQIDTYVEPTVKKALDKIVRPEQTCVVYLRAALREAEAFK